MSASVPPGYKRVGFTLPIELDMAIEVAVAKGSNATKSELASIALTEYLQRLGMNVVEFQPLQPQKAS